MNRFAWSAVKSKIVGVPAHLRWLERDAPWAMPALFRLQMILTFWVTTGGLAVVIFAKIINAAQLPIQTERFYWAVGFASIWPLVFFPLFVGQLHLGYSILVPRQGLAPPAGIPFRAIVASIFFLLLSTLALAIAIPLGQLANHYLTLSLSPY